MQVSQWMFRVKKYGYLIFLVPIFLAFLAAGLGISLNLSNYFTYLPFLVVFFVVPVLDYLIGKDQVNPDVEQQLRLEQKYYYTVLTLLCVPLLWSLVVFGAYYFSSEQLNWWSKIGWALSVGTVTGGIGITVAHELIHKNNRYERVFGGLLLSLVSYATFKVEHVRGHHMWVATAVDASSSKLNQSLYNFLKQALSRNFINGWRLERARLEKKNISALSWQNELLRWYSLTIVFALTLTVAWGWQALVFFLLQSLVAILLLEIVNYIEHYGLTRNKSISGDYVHLTEMHSWNSNYLLSNLILFQLQRHSDHHLMAKRRYQALLHRENSPQLPGGYPSMILLALIPPLWFRIINPRINSKMNSRVNQGLNLQPSPPA